MNKIDHRKTNKTKWLIIISFIVAVYFISLFVPYISNVTRYPIYVIKCGGQPVTATKFAASYTYTVPGGSVYYFFDDIYFCTEQEAQEAGFKRYP